MNFAEVIVSCGKNSAPTGRVVYVRPLGEVQMTVPSGCCNPSSPHPAQNV